MKRLSFFCLLLMLGVLVSCNDKAGDNTATGGDPKEMLEANRAVQKAIETGDTATLQKYIADDATDHGGGPNGADLKGDDIITMLASVHNDIDNLKFDVMQEAANDDHVFSLVHMTGTTNKPVWGMPANFKVDSKSIDLVKIKDGKMVDHWGFFDMNEMMKMMQMAPPPNGGMGNMGMDSTKK